VYRELAFSQYPQPKSFGEVNAALKICDTIITSRN